MPFVGISDVVMWHSQWRQGCRRDHPMMWCMYAPIRNHIAMGKLHYLHSGRVTTTWQTFSKWKVLLKVLKRHTCMTSIVMNVCTAKARYSIFSSYMSYILGQNTLIIPTFSQFSSYIFTVGHSHTCIISRAFYSKIHRTGISLMKS